MGGLRWKKTKTIGIPGFKRYLHFKIYATQKGLSSYGVKVGPATWNSTKKGLRWDLWGGFYVDNRKPRHGNRRERRGGGQGGTTNASGKTSGRTRKRRGPLTAPVAWAGRWAGRGARWSAHQTAVRSRGYVERASAPGRMAADRYRRFGTSPVVVDLFSGEEQLSQTVTLPDPDYEDPRVATAAGHAWHQQWLADDAARVDHALRRRPLTFMERLAMRWRGEDPDKWEDTSDWIRTQMWTQRLAGQAAATNPWRGQPARTGPEPVDLDDPGAAGAASGARGGHAVANTVKSWQDLHDPAIDPVEYAQELPDQLGEYAGMVQNEAEARQEQADARRRAAEAATAYADYMETAEVDTGLVAQLRDAAEALHAAAKSAQDIADSFRTAADAISGAKKTADNVYGETKPPNFRRAG